MRWMLPAAGVLTLGQLLLAQPPPPEDDPTPGTLDAFKAAAASVLDQTRVPGAAVALVGVNGVEWAGGFGMADRDAGLPVDGDTHFRAGSISKTFVAMALVQLYEDGKLDLDAPIRTLLPEIAVLGAADRLVPVNDALFRRDDELTASMTFTEVDGQPVHTGIDVYAERRAQWPLSLLQAVLATALALAVGGPVAALPHASIMRRRRLPTAGWLGVAWTAATAALVAIFAVAATAPLADLGGPTDRAIAIFAASLAYPLLALALVPLTIRAWRLGLRGWFVAFALLVASAHGGLAVYLAFWGLVGFRVWTY